MPALREDAKLKHDIAIVSHLRRIINDIGHVKQVERFAITGRVGVLKGSDYGNEKFALAGGGMDWSKLFLVPAGCAIAAMIILAVAFHPPKEVDAAIGDGSH